MPRYLRMHNRIKKQETHQVAIQLNRQYYRATLSSELFMLPISRTFHPVGQGAFYSEQHGSFCLVYDCGTSSRRGPAKAYLDAFANDLNNNSKHIDLLCKSHFDSDHVNLIDELKKRVGIGRVLLPQLHDVEKILLLNLYRALQRSTDNSEKEVTNHKVVIELLENPSAFFGKETQVIYVKAALRTFV